MEKLSIFSITFYTCQSLVHVYILYLRRFFFPVGLRVIWPLPMYSYICIILAPKIPAQQSLGTTYHLNLADHTNIVQLPKTAHSWLFGNLMKILQNRCVSLSELGAFCRNNVHRPFIIGSNWQSHEMCEIWVSWRLDQFPLIYMKVVCLLSILCHRDQLANH